MDEDIIEPLPNNFKVDKFKFIPHRPVIKNPDAFQAKKIRAVFNASFSSGHAPALNNSVNFPADLMTNLVDLFLYFRTNRYFLTADIKAAFLNIKFADNEDSNHFSFVVYHKGQFHYFKYTSAIFGFVLSPMFLQAVLKFHSELEPDPTVARYIRDHFYVDNFLLTSNSKKTIEEAAVDTYDSLLSASFPLREFSSNVPSATDQILNNPETKVNSDNPYKLLGLIHEPLSDTLRIKNCELNPNANTKRQILSSMSSIFDPTGYLLPASSNSKLILRKVNELKLNWDDIIPTQLQIMWNRHAKDFNKLKDFVKVPRCAYNSDAPFNLNVFCDASKDFLSVAVYVTQDGKSNLLFAKNRLSPINPSRTIPSLELNAFEISVNVVLKIIKSKYFKLENLKSISFFSDSQVAITWILDKAAPKKKHFRSK